MFVLDSDSGLTVYQNPDQVQAERYSKLSGFTSLFVDSVYLCVASANSGFRIFKHYNGELINTPLIQNLDKLNFFFYSEGTIYFEAHNGLQIYHLDSSGLQKTGELKSLNKIVNAFSTEESIGFISSGGKISILNKNKYPPQVVYEYNLGFTPNSVSFYNNTLYITYVKPSRLLSIFDPYNQTNLTRLALWNAGVKIWKDNPLFGVGDIDLAEHYKKYKNPYDKEIQGHMHNNFIHVLVTLGLFGLLSVLFIFYRIISIDLKIINQTKNIKFVSSYALGAFGTFCGFLFSGLTELNFWDHEITTLIWFVFGLNVALFNSVRTEINN